MKKVIIDTTQWAKGISETALSGDGGYSPESAGFNLFRDEYVDVLTPSELGTVISGVDNNYQNLAIVKNETLVSGIDFIYCNENGKYYSINGSTITLEYDDSANASRYSQTYVNMIHYNNYYYTTKKQDIVRADNDYTTVDPNWFNTKTANSMEAYPHPMVVVEDILYIGDHGKLHIWDNTTFQEDAMDFGEFQVITAMVRHPNGRDLIVFAKEGGLFTSGSGQARAYYVDLLTMEFYAEKKIDFPVNAVDVLGGIMYVAGNRDGDDNYIGTFDGEEIQKITHPEFHKDTYMYPRNFGSMGNFLCVPSRDGQADSGILALGKVRGRNTFFKPWRQKYLNDSYELEMIIEHSPGKLLIFNYNVTDTEREARVIDFTETADNQIHSFRMESNRMLEAQKSWIRRIDIFFENPLASGMTYAFYLENYSLMASLNNPTNVYLGEMDYSTDGAINRKRFDCNIRTDDYQIRYEDTGSLRGKIKRIEIYIENEE